MYRVFACATKHEESFPLPHYCGIGYSFFFSLPTVGSYHRPAVSFVLDVLGRTVQSYSQMPVRSFFEHHTPLLIRGKFRQVKMFPPEETVQYSELIRGAKFLICCLLYVNLSRD